MLQHDQKGQVFPLNGFLPQSLVLSSRKMRARPFPQLDLEWSASGAAGGSRKVAEHRCSLWKLSLTCVFSVIIGR